MRSRFVMSKIIEAYLEKLKGVFDDTETMQGTRIKNKRKE